MIAGFQALLAYPHSTHVSTLAASPQPLLGPCWTRDISCALETIRKRKKSSYTYIRYSEQDINSRRLLSPGRSLVTMQCHHAHIAAEPCNTGTVGEGSRGKKSREEKTILCCILMGRAHGVQRDTLASPVDAAEQNKRKTHLINSSEGKQKIQ